MKALRADVFHANNVLAHVADLNGFVAGIHLLLKDEGMAVIEVPYVMEMIDRCEFDTIYHEHLCYFSVTALQALFRRHQLEIQDVERLPIHGGSIRLFLRQRGAARSHARRGPTARAGSFLGRQQFGFYSGFADRVEQVKGSLCRLLADLKAQGAQVAAYGAAAKGSTLLNYCGIGQGRAGFRCRSKSVQTGPIHARRPSAHLSAPKASGGDAGLHASADLELRGRNSGAAGGIPSARWAFYHPGS